LTELPLTGGCLCGGVRYEISEPPIGANYCHCTRCQRRTGTGASAQARVVDGSLTIVRGEELVREWDPGDGGYAKAFCSNCGAALWSHPPGADAPLAVRLGSFDGDPGVRPDHHQFTDYAAVWEPIPDDGLPRFPESSKAHR
jgi:hypothetical protein